MKISLLRSPGSKPMAACWVLLFSVSATRLATAAPLQEARVSQVIQDVRLLEAHGAPRPAVLNDKVTLERAVRTGKESRAELTFTDLTITRLGANTIFSLKARAREVDLTSGTILLAVPSGAAPVRANTTAVTAAVTGGTALLATGPPTKFMVLEGIGTIYPKGHPEKVVTVHAGEMVVVTEDGTMTEPVPFDVWLVLRTSPLITDFPPLPNLPLILEVANQQRAEQLAFAPTRLPSQSWVNVIDVTDLNANANPILVAARTSTPTPITPTPTPPITPTPPPPTPSKFGTPPVITSPVPYLITSGTTITTDPSITTNGVTDFGKIYRGPAVDGAFSLWAFGSTSPFDAAIDNFLFANPNHFPIAGFKFQSLSLNGNPTIDLSNGGVTKLALIGVDGITSGLPGGTLTFTGLDLLALATVNGSINLTSDVSFQGLPELAIYARGAGSNLILHSPISNIGILELAAQGSIQLTNPGTMSVGEFDALTSGGDLTLQIGGSLLLNGVVRLDAMVLPGATVASGGNLTLNVTSDYTNTSATGFSLLHVTNEGAHIGTGGNINASIGGNLTTTGTGGDFELRIRNTNGQIDNGGNITLNVNGNVSTQGQLSLVVENYDGSGNPAGHIGTGGNISVTTGGDFTAGSVDALINNRNGGSIVSGGHIAFNIGAGLTTQGDATFGISMRNDGPGGGTIGSDATVDINAASVSVGGAFTTFVSTNAGGSITGNAVNRADATGDLVAQGPILVTIGDTGFNQINPPVFIAGGHIGGNATVTLGGQNITTSSTASGIPGIDTMALEASIYTNGSGTIGGDAIVNVSASQDISAPGTVFFTVANGDYMGFGGGTIGGDAKLNISAVNFMAGILFAEIFNYGASIGGNANINFNLTSDLTAPGDALFHIFNYGGGDIVGNAAINVSAANISAHSLLAEIDNRVAGRIGGNAAINMNVSGNANVTNDATFEILGSDSAAAAAININGGSYNAGGTLLAYMDGNGTITFNNASAHADVLKAGVFGDNGTLRIGGGILSADTTLKLYAPGSNGALNFVSNVTLGGNSLKILAADSVTIFNGVVVTIGGRTPVDVYTNHANYTGFGGNGNTTGTFAGAGANNPQPLSSAPPFGPAGASPTVTTGGTASKNVNTKTLSSTNATSGKGGGSDLKITSGKATGRSINVRNTAELLSLLDDADAGHGGKIAISGSKNITSSGKSSRINADRIAKADRGMADIRHMRDRGMMNSRVSAGVRAF